MNLPEIKRITSGHTSLPLGLVPLLLGVTRQRVDALVEAGKLPVEPLLGFRTVRTSAVLSLIQARELQRQRSTRRIR